MHGTVRAPDGAGIPGIVVTDGRASVTTDADGRYDLPGDGRFVSVRRPAGVTAEPWWHRVATDETGSAGAPASPTDPGAPAAQSAPTDFLLTPTPQTLPYEFVHLTDTHLSDPSAPSTPRRAASLYPEGSSADQFATLLAELPSLAPDAQAVFLTGDLVDEGTATEYESLLRVLASSARPVHAIAGNHDHMNGIHDSVVSPNGYLTNTGDPALYEQFMGPRWYSFDVPGLHVVAMDWHTHELGIDSALQEEWLRGDLALVPDEMPWILLFHDQPSAAVLDAAPRPPLATFSGHWHTSRVVRIDGTLHVNTPPTFFAGLDYTPPMLRRVIWDGQQVAVNSVVVAPDTARPVPTVSATATVVGSGRPGPWGPARWVTPLAGAAVRQGVGSDDDDIVVGSQLEDAAAGSVDLIDRSTGEIRWSVTTAAAVKSTPAIGGDLVVVADVTGAVHGLDRGTGNPVWTSPSSDPYRRFAWGAPVIDSGRVVVGDQADLRCLDLATGEVLWRRTDIAPHHNLCNHSAPLIVGDLVVVGFWPSPDHPLGIDLATGRDRWNAPGPDAAAPADSAAVKRLLVMGTGAHDEATGAAILPAHGLTLAVGVADGRRRWAAPHEGGFSPAAPVVTDRGVVVTVGGVGLRMLDRADGSALWDTPVSASAALPFQPYAKAGGVVLAPPTPTGDRLVLPCLDGAIRTYALDGSLTRTVAHDAPLAAPLADAGDLLVGVDVDGRVIALPKEGLL
ncbi:outer membrane protein assembly factor BamB family protein [Dietzia sp. NPDC055340]